MTPEEHLAEADDYIERMSRSTQSLQLRAIYATIATAHSTTALAKLALRDRKPTIAARERWVGGWHSHPDGWHPLDK